jgi:hypothetical protein
MISKSIFPIDKLLISLTGIILATGVFAQIKLTQPLTVENFNYYIDTVYVAQEEQKIVGYHWKSKSKRANKFKKFKNISLGFKDYFDLSFPNDGIKQPLIVRINKILCSTSEVSNKSNTILHISFLQSNGNEYYHLYSTSATYNKQMEYGVSNEIAIDIYLRKVLTACFNNFVKHNNPSKKEIVSKFDLSDLSTQYKNKLEIFTSNRDREAIAFKTFSDFITDKGVVDKNLRLKKVIENERDFYYEQKESDTSKVLKYHMIFDGENYFINHDSKYYKLFVVNENHIQFQIINETSESVLLSNLLGLTAGLTVGAVLRNNSNFGILLNALIVGVTAGAVYYMTSEISKSINRIHRFELDLLTGYTYRVP